MDAVTGKAAAQNEIWPARRRSQTGSRPGPRAAAGHGTFSGKFDPDTDEVQHAVEIGVGSKMCPSPTAGKDGGRSGKQ